MLTHKYYDLVVRRRNCLRKLVLIYSLHSLFCLSQRRGVFFVFVLSLIVFHSIDIINDIVLGGGTGGVPTTRVHRKTLRPFGQRGMVLLAHNNYAKSVVHSVSLGLIGKIVRPASFHGCLVNPTAGIGSIWSIGVCLNICLLVVGDITLGGRRTRPRCTH